ncbi:MAG: M23 family metallopeptidase, partial [Paraprevotella sp.]|nr:M23 family metallopeptidase [Paraprevotella sp.]
MKKSRIMLYVAFVFFSQASAAQKVHYHSPVDIPFVMSGSFGEPRPNHFHCGIDVKTQGVTGKHVLAVSDGYVSRLTVGYDGFGLAAYVTHPDGYISVYCHLERFVPELQEIVRLRQYEEETEQVDVKLPPTVFPVKAGDLIAYSGNTGASLAPHLHLELHRASDGLLVDPLPYFCDLVKDALPPVAHGVKLYPCPEEGVVDGSGQNRTFTVTSDPSARVIQAWGRIGAALWADDYMDGTYNRFGIHSITLRVDGKQIFRCLMDAFMPVENPMVNSWGDYSYFRQTQHWYLKSFVDPGNTLSVLHTDQKRGWVDINEERDYRFEYILEDLKGNSRTYRFTVRGKRTDALLTAERQRENRRLASGILLQYDRPQVVQRPGMELSIPSGALTKDEVLHLRMETQKNGLANRYILHDELVPLVKRAVLMLSPLVPVSRPEKCYIESSHGYIGGEYKEGWFSASIRDLGEAYTLAIDTTPPRSKWLSAVNGNRTGVLRCSVTDNGSGVKSFKAYVDGHFILFTSYRGVWTCRLQDTPVRA